MKNLKRIICVLLAVIIIAAQVFAAEVKVYNATLLPETYQTIRQWGVYPSSISDWWPDKYAAHKAIYRDMGITMARIEIRGQCGDGDGNLVKEYTDMLALHIQTGVNNGINDFLASVWTPPAGMKTNNKIEGQNEDGTRATLLPEKEELFCKYIVNVFNDLRKRGLPVPKVFSLQNEPNNAFDYYQCCYYDLEQYKRVFKLMRKTLDENGYSHVRMTGAEGAQHKDNLMWFGEGFSELETDKEFGDAVDIISSHAYYNPAVAFKKDIDTYTENVQKFPDKEVWQTEYSTAHNQKFDLEIDRAMGGMRVFTTDVAWIGVNGWFWWIGWDPRYPITDAHQEAILAGDGITGVDKSLIYQSLAKIWKNVPAGSKVMRLSTDDPEVVNTSEPQSDMVAFSNGQKTVILFTNTSKEDKIYNFCDLSGNSAEVYTAVSTESGLYQASNRNLTGGTLNNVAIPARSINIIVAQSKDKAPPSITYEKAREIGVDGDVYVSRDQNLNLDIKVDEASDVLVNKKKVALNDDFSYTRKLLLNKGVTRVRLDARDKAGNRTQPLFLQFRYDPKYVDIQLSKTEDISNNDNYVINGSVNVKSDILVNGEPIELDENLNFSHEIKLSQGDNALVLTATDESGNKSKDAVLNVFCDSIAPEIRLANTEFTTADSEFVVIGSLSKPVKALEIGGKEIKIRDDLSFISKVSLSEGENEISLKATDFVGNIGVNNPKITFNKTDATPNPTTGTANTKKATSRININGNIDEADWKLDQKASKVISGTANNIVNFGTLWDSNYLYVAAKIYDTALVFDDDRVYQNDCFEIFLNPTNSKKGKYEEKDMQLFTGYGKGRGVLHINTSAECLTAWKDFDGGYTIEMAVPWKDLGITPSDGMKIGFDVMVDDKDVTGAREAVIGWFGTSDNWQNTSGFGTLILTN